MGDCPGVQVAALIDKAAAEPDEIAKIAYGSDIEESIWVNYYIDRGRVGPEVKLVNEATKGWQPDFSSELFMPKEPGPMRIWAVVRDNRGGLSWARIPAYVRNPNEE